MGKRIISQRRGREITVLEFYDLIEKGSVSVGDRFIIKSEVLPLKETIFQIHPNGMVDTLIEFRTRRDMVGECRYVPTSRYKTDLGVHERGSKEYHNLLENQEVTA